MSEQRPDDDIYRGALIHVRVKTLPAPLGGTDRYEIVEHPDSVAIVALRELPEGQGDPLVALVRQMRPAIGRETWELPAGLINPGEADWPEDAAARELREETGFAARSWRRLAREYVSPGFTTECVNIYLATDVYAPEGSGTAVPRDTTEIEQVSWVPLGEALARCASGEIEDGKTLLGLMLANATLASREGVRTGGGSAMPNDVTNMPFRRDAPFREVEERATDEAREKALGRPLAESERLDGTLHLEHMLLEEFNYAGQTAYQAMEDRARMFNLYLLLIGVLGSALGAVYQLGGHDVTKVAEPISIALLIVAGILGIVFFAQLIRLRQAYRESLIAMNTVKEYYIEEFREQVPGSEKAFRWRLRTIPTGERLGSVTFLVCYTVAFLGSLCFAGAAVVIDAGYVGPLPLPYMSLPGTVQAGIVGALVLVAFLVWHISFYVRALSKKKERASLEKQAKSIGVELTSTKG